MCAMALNRIGGPPDICEQPDPLPRANEIL
jgi:hypothetical protein